MIEVLRAHRDGRKVQWKFHQPVCGAGADWTDLCTAEHPFNFSITDYRVKPEPPKPREWDLRGWHVYEVGGAGSINALADVGNNPIRVREVLQ